MITQETDHQISTYNASSIEQRAIFDASPKLGANANKFKDSTIKKEGRLRDSKTDTISKQGG